MAIKRGAVNEIANADTAFGINMPAGAVIFDKSANLLWEITESASATSTLNTLTKDLLSGAQNIGDLEDVDIVSPVNGEVLTYNSSTGDWENNPLAGGGDMLKSTYDPTNVSDDAFDMENMAEGVNNKIFTAAERTKLDGIAAGADMLKSTYDTTNRSKELFETSQGVYVDATKGDDVNGNGSINYPYASIQTAIDSITDNSVNKRYIINIAPGIYEETIIMKSYVCLSGRGAIVRGATGPLVTLNGDFCLILDLVFELNPTVSGQTVFSSTGLGEYEINFCELRVNVPVDVTASLVTASTGDITLTDSICEYTQTGSSVTVNEHNIFNLSGNASFRPLRDEVNVTITDEADNVNIYRDDSTGVFTMTQVANIGATTNLAYSGTFNVGKFSGVGDIKIVGYSLAQLTGAGTGTGQVLELDSLTNNATIDITFNKIQVTGFATNRGGNIGTGDTVNAYYNEISVETLSTGDGNVNIVAADTNGRFVVNTDIVDLNTFIGNSTNQSLNDLFNIGFNAGWVSGGAQSEPGTPDGTLTVAAGTGNIRTSNDEQAQIQMFDWAETTGLTFTTGVTSYVYVDYNAGSPIVTVTTNLSDIEDNENDKFELYAVFKEDATTLHIADHRHRAKNVGSRIQQYLHDRLLIERTSGLLLGGTGIRYITVTAGRARIKLNPIDLGPKDTSVSDTFDYYYNCGATCVKLAGSTQWDNAQWDNAGVLTAYTNGRYGFIDMYLDAQDKMVGVYCTAQYTAQVNAENADLATPPNRVLENGLYIGRIVFLEGTDTPASVLSPFTGQELSTTPVTDHGQLSGLTDDDHLQYALLAGRSGGQTLYGSTDASENLTLESTSNVTKGTIIANGNTQVNGTLDADSLTLDTPLPIAEGGTGQNNKTDAFDALAPTTSNYDTIRHNGTDNVRVKNNQTTTAPTVNDDTLAGYVIGSRWIDTVADKEYVALDITAGAAVWTETTKQGDVTLTGTQTLTNKTLTDAKLTYSINTQTGTTYTFALTDQTKIVEMNNASANTITIPTNASVAFPVGTTITVVQYGAGLTTVTGDTGVTVNGVSAGSKATTAQYEGLALYKRATDEWIVINR